MPNRILREGFVDSEAINALSDFAHRLYTNLIVKCDDAGRYDGRLTLLRSQLFPLGTPRRIEDVRKAVTELAAPKDEEGKPLPPLVILYDYAGKPYIQLVKVQRCGKGANSRYPWKDGNHKFAYVVRETRDGPKEFVSTSLVGFDSDGVGMGSDPIGTPSAPHADGVVEKTGATNTSTSTETDTSTSGDDSQSKGGAEADINAYLLAHPLLSAACLSEQRKQPLRDLVRLVGWDRARGYVDKAIAMRKEMPLDYAMGIYRGELRSGKTTEIAAPRRKEAPVVIYQNQ